MKEINLTKYGFIRDRENDFTDDGNRFFCYTAGDNIRVSKCTHKDDVYISASLDGQLPYETYSKLPHYNSLDELNGVVLSELEDEDLYKFYSDCLAYEREYNEALKSFTFPSLEELNKKRIELNASYEKQLEELKKDLIPENILNLEGYQFEKLKDYYKGIQDKIWSEERLSRIVNTSYSLNYMKGSVDEWYFNRCKEILSSK